MIGQPDFLYLTAGQKIKRIDDYKKLKNELLRTREMRSLLENASINDQAKYTDTFEHANSLIAQIDDDPSLSYSKAAPGMCSDLQLTSTGINSLIQNHFEEHYGIEGITYDNIEQVYNPKISGISTIAETREYLIQ